MTVDILHGLACADAYLTPCIKRYVTGFMSGFKKGIEVNCIEEKFRIIVGIQAVIYTGTTTWNNNYCS